MYVCLLVVNMSHYRRHIVPKVVLQLLRAPKSGFSPAGATRCTDFGKTWHGGVDQRSTPPCQILPKSVHGWGRKTPKTENFTKFWNINAPQGHFPCSISTKLSACMRSAFPDWCLHFGRNRSHGSEVIGV